MERKGNKNPLRQKAEALLKKKSSGTVSPFSEVDSLRLIHELEVHQIELELQNEELRHAWAEAEVANDKYIRLYDFAPSGYFTLSCKGEIIELNLSGARMLGKDRQHLKNSLFGFFVSEETKPIFSLFLEKTFESKAKESCEVTMDSDGSLPVHVFLTGVLEGNGERCQVTMVEITKLRQAQLDLLKAKEEAENSLLKYRISESDLKKAQSIAQLGSWKWSVKTGEVIWSDEMFNIFGLDKNSYSGSLGDAITKVIHPDDLYVVLPENASEFSINRPREYRIILPDNSIRHICAQAGETILDDSGNPLFLSGVAQDITTHKLVEIELRESNELSKSLLQTIPFGLDIVDGKGNVLFLSDNLKQYFGDESLGKKCWDLYRDDKKQCSDCPLHAGITIGETKKYEAQGVLGGKTFEIYHTGMIFNGQKAMLEVFIDISERKKAEDLLQESEKRYRTTIESISDAFFTLDNELRFTYFNKQAEELLLKTSSDVLGKQIFSEVFKEAKGSVFEEKYTHALTAKEISTFETFFGIEPYVNWYDVRVYPGTEGISVFFRVITEKKKADSALHLSLSKYQTLFDLFPAGITLSDSNGQIIETNSIAQRLLGLAPEEQKQRQIDGEDWQIIRADGSPMPASEFASVRALNEKCQIENVEMGIRKADDHVTWINVSATPIPIEGYGVAIIYIDITARKQAEQEVIIAKEKAEESDRLKSAFLSNMSHEIRTPMNGILGFAGLLKEPGLNGEEQQKYIRIIEKSGTRMLNIINDIIDISKIEAGLMEVDITESNINEQIEYIYTFFKPEVEGKGMHLSYINSLPAKKALVETDREKIYAILTNLVKNAIKYSKEGSIEFGYTIVETQRAASLQTPHAAFVRFFVKDTGLGIAKNRQDAIFERFIQANVIDSHVYQGAGLGLSISKAYVEMLGGKIWVESEPGKGSTFYFTIPYNEEKQTQHNEANVVSQDDESVQIRKLKILIAEDDETSDLLITAMLKKNNHEVIHVNTGNQAVEACRNSSGFDLILMDIRMPGMDGYEATRQIRQFNKDVIIIAQTAYGLSGERENAIESGCNDYVAKPINREELQQLMQKYFSKNSF